MHQCQVLIIFIFIFMASAAVDDDTAAIDKRQSDQCGEQRDEVTGYIHIALPQYGAVR